MKGFLFEGRGANSFQYFAYDEGVTKDYKEAVRWYRLAAKQGHTGAQLNLGRMYRDGRGVVQDLVVAYVCLAGCRRRSCGQLCEGNRANIERFIEYSHDQELIEAPIEAKSLFAAGTLDS